MFLGVCGDCAEESQCGSIARGKLAINTMADILDGREVKDRIPIPPTVVTKDNVDTATPAF